MIDEIREQISRLSDLESEERTLGNHGAADDVLTWRITMERLLAVYEKAQRIIKDSRTHENGNEQIGVVQWVALAHACDAVQTSQCKHQLTEFRDPVTRCLECGDTVDRGQT